MRGSFSLYIITTERKVYQRNDRYYNIQNSKAVFTANINSVFDICWYTLSKFIATNSSSLDLDLSIDTEDFRSAHIGVCRSCGRYMEMKSNRQLYCKRTDCQKDRNRRKQKDFQQRKREMQIKRQKY